MKKKKQLQKRQAINHAQIAKMCELKTLSVTFDIQKLGEKMDIVVSKENRRLTLTELLELTSGNYLQALYSEALPYINHKWNVSISTTVKNRNGDEKQCFTEYDVPVPLSFAEMLDYEQQKAEINGKRWRGIVDFWLRDIDQIFDDEYECQSAICTMTCKAYVFKRYLQKEKALIAKELAVEPSLILESKNIN